MRPDPFLDHGNKCETNFRLMCKSIKKKINLDI